MEELARTHAEDLTKFHAGERAAAAASDSGSFDVFVFRVTFQITSPCSRPTIGFSEMQRRVEEQAVLLNNHEAGEAELSRDMEGVLTHIREELAALKDFRVSLSDMRVAF